jgi:putative RecB family exonuclease
MSCRTRTPPDERSLTDLLQASIERHARPAQPWSVGFPAIPAGKQRASNSAERAELKTPLARRAADPQPAQPMPAEPCAPGERLSPSQINGYLDCSARWKFRYVDRLPDSSTGSQARGRAVHALIGYWFRERMKTGVAPDVGTLREAWAEIWDRETVSTQFARSENIEDLRSSGFSLALQYLAERAPSITPAALEVAVSGYIGGVPVRGFVDILDTSGRIIDLKTTARKPSTVAAGHAMQLATYAHLTPGASGIVSLDTLVATKKHQLVPIEYIVPEADFVLAERMYPAVQRAMRSGYALPNRGSMFCSRKNCEYADACEAEFGGLVE